MVVNFLPQRFRFAPDKWRFLQQNPKAIVLWPASCLGLGIVLATVLISSLQHTRKNLEEHALREAKSLAETYAFQIGRTIGELDHVTALLKAHWERSNGTLRLEDIDNEDKFVDTALAAISLINRDGIIVSSTLPGAVGMSVKDRSYFRFHQANPTRELHIGSPVFGRLGDREIVTFTRRLSLSNGNFDGIVSASTGTRFLAQFANTSTMGATGVLVLVGTDGTLRAAKIGNDIESLLAPKVIKEPISNPNASFITSKKSDWFRDDEVRYIGAYPVPGYPLHAVVGLGQTDVLHPYVDAKREYIRIGIVGGLVLALFGIVAFVMSVRLEWRKHRETTVKQAYRMATEHANEGFYMWRRLPGTAKDGVDFELVDCNERGAELYGRSRNALIGIRHHSLYSGQSLERINALIATVLEKGFYEDEFETVQGSVVGPDWIYRKFVQVEDGIIVTLRDISERKKLEQEKSELAERDSLTQLPNRHWLTNYLPAAFERANMKGESIAVLFIDLDKFKNINDTWGHSTGDQLLHSVSTRIRSVLRPGDTVARFGGDEFIGLLEGITHEDHVTEIANRIRNALEQPFDIKRHSFTIGASIGISMFPKDGNDVETLIRNADIAMYAAKAEPTTKHRFFVQELFTRIHHQTELERSLALAVEEDQFVVHYQPRFDVKSGLPVGMEALVRWRRPEKGLVFPGEFIAVAESSHLIVQLGEIVMDKVCQQVAAWRKQGLSVLPVSVNVSAKQFHEEGVSALLQSTLRRHGLPSSSIEIELTESIMVSHSEQVSNELRAIHALGISVHLDDFGTGYSSLSTLQELDVDVLKVDKSFTNRLGQSKEGEIFFKAIISMAKALEMRVIAEGVETDQQLQALRLLECDEIQGYVFSRPLPPEDVVKYFERRIEVE